MAEYFYVINQINVYNIASISLIISILGFGSAITRWLSTGRISDLTTVILPIGVDTSVILDESEESLNETLLELEWFKKISGLKIFFSKTQVIPLSIRKHSAELPLRLTADLMLL
jgi:hypothetical protein